MARASKRNLVIDTAEMLFTQNGFTATGINQITREADVASMTLYNNFKSKDELVLAVLARAHGQIFDGLVHELETVGDAADVRILAIFDYMEKYATSQANSRDDDGSFTGNLFNNAASEFRALSHPVHQVALEHTQRLQECFEELAVQLGHPSPRALAQTLLLLLEGAFSSAQVMGDMSLFKRARSAAKTLLDLHQA